MTIGDQVRATYPYGGVPSGKGKIIKEVRLGRHRIQFLVSFETRSGASKKFYLTARELTPCPALTTPEA